ncbi:glycosyltransferase family 9 protein [Luteibacter sp. NPDC031894]|uniref:glycosyltransferase family 9 protein n=1 Tax=Luteibacter sp. NPDC031894 TaxID=3390572 RepID=UPI003D089757
MTPLIAELERWYPGAEVDVLGAGVAALRVYGGYTGLGELHVLDRRAIHHPLTTWRLLRMLRRKQYDLVIDAASGSSSGRLVTATARARYRIGVRTLACGAPTHLAARPVHALRLALGVPMDDPVPSLDLRLSDVERANGRATLGRVLKAGATGDAPVLTIFPNATGAKRYDQHWWTIFLAELERAAGPFRIIELVAADGVSRVGNRYPTYFTSDPRKLASLIDAAGLYVSADCGVMHLAAGTTAQTIGLFATTDPSRYAPYGPGNTALWTGDDGPSAVAHRAAGHILRQRDNT